MDSVSLASEILSIIESKASVKNRYSEEIDWLKDRKMRWQSDKIRIGVVGVTSSGKSTMINALLGDELLSTAVKPSSCQLVRCFKAKDREAIVTLESGNKILLRGKKLTKNELSYYSDERENSNNKKKVVDIQLTTPKFDLSNKVELIDSAGLDAYKLEYHEKLTLEVLIPTVDICIFVTTLKSNSDAKAKEVINTIAKYECPLLIVQNMLDSVEPSADGTKTREMVAEEHRKRVQKIIDKSDINSKNDIRIIQMSAILAMQARCNQKPVPKESNYINFINVFNSVLDNIEPQINLQRNKSVFKRFNDFVNEEKKHISNITSESEEFLFKGLNNQIDKKYNRTADLLRTEINKLRNCKINVTKSNVSRVINDVKNDVKNIEERLLTIISDFNKYIGDMAHKIAMPLRDVFRVTSFTAIPEPIKFEKYVSKSIRRKKKYPLSGFVRWLGDALDKDWGYEYGEMTVKELDKTRTEKELLNYTQRAMSTYSHTIKEWLVNMQGSVARIKSEVLKLERSYENRQKKILEEENLLEVICKIEKIIEGLDVDDILNSSNRSSHDFVSNLQEISVSPYQIGLLRLSTEYLQKIYSETLRVVLDYCKANNNHVLISWDYNSLFNFSWRFFARQIDAQSKRELEKNSELNTDALKYILNPENTHLKKLEKKEQAYNFFILVNAQQDGAAKKQIDSLGLSNILSNGDKVFFVIQDFDGLTKSRGILEMRRNLMDYYKDFKIENNRGMFLINDDNPLFNMVYVQNQINPCVNQNEEMELIKLIKERFVYLLYDNSEEVIADLIKGELVNAK